MRKGRNFNNLRSFVIILCLWFSAFASLYSDSANSIALYVALPFAFCLSFFKQKSNLDSKYFAILTTLIIWIVISFAWAIYEGAALAQLKQLLGTFILAHIYTSLSREKRYIPYLYVTYIILFIGACIYAKNNILVDMVHETDRLDDEKLNANTLAYFLFYVTFTIFQLREHVNGVILKRVMELLFILTIPLSFMVAILTASRQVFIIQIPLISILLYFRYIKNYGIGRKVLSIAIIVAGLVIAWPYATKTYDESYLKTRNELEINEDSRMALLKSAISVGNQHFPLGVGPGNYIFYSPDKHFSHNSYAELYANEGVIGLILYLWLMCLFIKRQYKRYRESGDKQYAIFLLFGLVYAADGFFFVFYSHLWLMGMFMLVAGHSESYYREQTMALSTNSQIKR